VNTLYQESSAISPDGKYLATMDLDIQTDEYFIDIMDTSSGKVIRTIDEKNIKGLPFPAYIKAISPNGEFAVLGGYQQRAVYLYNLNKGLKLKLFNNPITVLFSENGEYLVCHYWRQVDVYNLKKVEKLVSIPEKYCHSIALSPDSRLIAIVAGDIIKVWDIFNKTRVTTLPGYWFTTMAFSHYGKFLATTAFDNQILILDYETRKEVAFNSKGYIPERISHPEDCTYVPFLFFSPDDKVIVACNNNENRMIQFVNTETMKRIKKMSFDEQIGWASYSPDGKKFLLEAGPQVKIWDNG
jgi:WD40 repeat protein